MMETLELVLVIEPCFCPAFKINENSQKSDWSFLPNKNGLLTSSAIKTQLTKSQTTHFILIFLVYVSILNYTCTLW